MLASDGLLQSKTAARQVSARGEPESKTNRGTKRNDRHKKQAKRADTTTHTARISQFLQAPLACVLSCFEALLRLRLVSVWHAWPLALLLRHCLLPSDRCMLRVQDNHHFALWAREGDTQKTTRLRRWSRRAPFYKKNKIKILSF